MTHRRTAIRDAVVTAVTGLATTANRVFSARMAPQDGDDLPCLLVTTNDESAQSDALDGSLDRVLTVTVTGVAKGTGDVDATLNTIAEEVETAIGAGISVGGRTQYPILANIRTDFDDRTDQPVGLIELDFQINYFTAAGVPGAFH